MVDWNGGMEWTGMVDWKGGMAHNLKKIPHSVIDSILLCIK